MILSPTTAETIARARSDLRMGLPVVLRGDSGAGLVAVAIETVGAERLAQILSMGPAHLAITGRRAETLHAHAYDGDVARVEVSPTATLAQLRAIADPARDLETPLKGPFKTARDGDATLHRAALSLAKRAVLLPAVLTLAVDDPAELAERGGLTLLSGEMLTACLDAWSPQREISAARVPLLVSSAGRVHVFRAEDGAEEHYAIEIGMPDRSAPVLARLHSACFTGDVIGSLKCDCGPQLNAALAAIADEGSGVLLYLNQEGRGIGLANKMRAYALQDQGFDTVEANHRLGFEDDERNFRVGAELMRGLGFSAVRLMTNNPRKVAMMEASGIAVTERVPLAVGVTDENRDYLRVKRDRSGHLL